MANAITNLGFSDYTAEQADIERRRAYAQALQQQGATPIGPTEMAGGWAIRKSPLEGLAKMLQSYQGRKGQDDATAQQKALGQKYQSDLARTLMQAQTAGAGSPAQSNPAVDDPAAGQYAPASTTPAVAPDRQAMARILMGHPGTAPLGMARMSKDMDQQSRQASLAGIMGLSAGGGGAAPGASGAAGAPSGGGNMLAGIPPQIVALMTSGDAELVKLGTTLMEANKGVAQRAGAPVVNPFTGAVIAQAPPALPQGMALGGGGPNGFTAAPVPGFAAAQAGLHEIPNASTSPIKLKTSSGQEIELSQPEYVNWQKTGQLPIRYGSQKPPSVPSASPIVGNSPAGNVNIQSPTPAMLAAAARDPDSAKALSGLGTVGASQPQSDVIDQARQTAAGKEVDQTFAKDYVQFTTGGAQDSAKQISQLGDVVKQLNTPGAKLTGAFIGSLPDAALKFNATGRNAIAMRERVEEVVQRSLRSILGSQFTEKEGERLIARAYNPNLSEKENAVRVGRLATQLQQAYAAKQDAASYFQKNNTLQGWKGKLPSMSDFDPDAQTASGKVGKTPLSPATLEFLKQQGVPVD